MVQHNVGFIGGDFNMSAFSTVGDVFSDPEFVTPGNALLWCIGSLDDSCKDCTGFLIMPKRPYDWRVDLGFVLVTRLRTSLFSFTSASVSPKLLALTASRAVLKLSNVAWRGPRPKRKRLVQQAASNPLATQPKSSLPLNRTHHPGPSIQLVPSQRRH